MLLKRKNQTGLTLIELMIGMVIGLIITAATITLFLTIMKSNADNVKMIRLTQDMRNVMTLITRDIRRTGYWSGPVGDNSYIASWNEGLQVGEKISLSYDANAQGDKDAGDNFEYIFEDGTLKFVKNSQSSPILDDSLIEVTEMSFDVDTITLKSAEIRTVNVTLSAHLKNDPDVSKTFTDTIRVRNDEKL